MSGIQEIEALKDGGFSEQEINDHIKTSSEQLLSGGYSQQEVNDFFGIKEVNREPIKTYWQQVKDSIIEPVVEAGKKREKLKEGIVGKEFQLDTILERGLGRPIGTLAYNLATNKGVPSVYKTEEPEDYTFFEGLLDRAISLGLDLPAYGLGGAVGLPGGLYSSAFTAGFIPEAARATMLKMLQDREAGNSVDVLNAFIDEGLKAGAISGTQFIGTALAPGLLGPLGKTYLGKSSSQLLAFEGIGSALHGELPTAREFAYSGALFFGLNAIASSRAKLKAEKTFVETGKKPTDIYEDSIINKTIDEDMASINIQVPRAYKKPDLTKPIEKVIEPEKTPEERKTALDRNKEKIVFEQEVEPLFTKERISKINNAIKEKKDSFIINHIDEKYPVLKYLRELGVETRTGIEKLNTYEITRLLEGIPGKSFHFIEYNTLNADNSIRGLGLKPVLREVIKGSKNITEELKNLDTYAASKRDIELKQRGIKTPFKLEDSLATVNDKNNKIKYEKPSKELIRISDDALLYAVERGKLLSKETYNVIKEFNKDYVPFQRDIPKEKDKGFDKSFYSPFKKIKGNEELKLLSPTQTIIKNIDFLIRNSEINNAKLTFIDEALANKVDWVVKKETKIRSTKVLRKELEDRFGKEFVSKLSDDVVDNFTLFRAETATPDKGDMVVFRNGKREVYTVGEDIANVFKITQDNTVSIALEALRFPAKTLRAGAIVQPDFALPNFFKDTLQATFLSKVTWFPIGDSFWGLFKLIIGKKFGEQKALEMYKKFVRSGGMQSTLTSFDKSLYDEGAQRILNQHTIRNKLKHPVDFVLSPFQILTEYSENMTRFRLFEKTYERARKLGLPEQQAIERAGFESRDLYDYAKQGTIGKSINRYIPFWTAAKEGVVKIYEGFRDRPQRTTTMVFIGVVLPTVGLYLVNQDEDYYKGQPQWVKDKYWVFRDPFTDTVRKFPKPYQIGEFFSGITERTLDWIKNEDEVSFTQFATDFLYSNAKSFIPVPQAIRPWIENITNYSIFKDAPVVDRSVEGRYKNSLKYNEYTSETIKQFASLMNKIVGDESGFANPFYIQNVLDSYFGRLGQYATKILDKAILDFGLVEEGERVPPKSPISWIPGVRAFEVREPAVQGYIEKFYKEYNKVQLSLNTLDELKARGDTKRYQEEFKKTPFDKSFLTKVKTALDAADKKIVNINNLSIYAFTDKKEYDSKSQSEKNAIKDSIAEQKRELIDQQLMLKGNFAKDALNYMNKQKKQVELNNKK